MAQAIPIAQLQARIDDYLTYLLDEWQGIPDLAAEWAEWEEHERLDFVLEWPIREDRLHQLRERAAAGQLTPRQQARYEHVLDLERRHRPLLERLLAD
jgi:hypothetical protein